MSDHVEFGLHDLPWEPAHAELVHVLRYYDGPQAGVIRQQGAFYAFHALLDLPDGAGLWFYARLDHAEAEKLIGTTDATDADALLHAFIDDRPGTLAVAMLGVVAEAGEADGARLEYVSRALPPLLANIKERVEAYGSLDRGPLVPNVSR